MMRFAALVATLGLVAAPARAFAAGNCTTMDIELMPALHADAENQYPMQIVAWIEDASGTYRDTIFITQSVGRLGIGNRPGRFDFNSGPKWPYGRRTTTFPVWAHKHGMTFPDLVFQNGQDSNLSHPMAQSSPDPGFCAPMMKGQEGWDTGTCASIGYTDKGTFGGTSTSLYPPRQDVTRATGIDDPAVEMFDMLNPFDAISQPTPPSGQLATLQYAVPESLEPGTYTLWVEVSKEFDMNSTYNPQSYPSPDVPWETYGLPYRGQPSVLYKVPFTLDAVAATTASTADYVGYGDPDGLDGDVRPPDNTITLDQPGSGGARLQLISANSEMYRVKLSAKPENDATPPAMPTDLELAKLDSRSVTLAFTAPGDDGMGGKISRYEVRIRAGEEITEANFDSSALAAVVGVPADGGTLQELEIKNLLWETDYSVGIRAIDNCRNVSPLVVTSFRTAERELGSVDACFVATAAYGSVMANDVEELRGFRDSLMRKTIFGELAVEAYYTFGPAVSGAIGASDVLRATTRSALAPVVGAVKQLLP